MENVVEEPLKLIVKEVTGIQQTGAEIEKAAIEKAVLDNPPPATEPVKPVEKEIVEPEIEDEKLFGILSKKFGKEIKSLEDLKEKEIVQEELPEDVSAFYKYKKETGRGWEDFTKAQRDFKSMDPNDMISEFYSQSEEGLDKEDIQTMMNKFVIDEDIDTESEQADKKLAFKKALREAKSFFKKQHETYSVPLVPSPATVPDEDKEEFESYKQYMTKAKSVEAENARLSEIFDHKTNEVLNKDFKGFEFKVKIGDEEKILKFAPGTADELKSVNSNPSNFFKRFMDDKNVMQDVKGYHRDFSVGMNPDKFAQFFVEQGFAMATEANDKLQKNINMGIRQVPQPLTNGIRAKEVPSPPTQVQVKTKYI